MIFKEKLKLPNADGAQPEGVFPKHGTAHARGESIVHDLTTSSVEDKTGTIKLDSRIEGGEQERTVSGKKT